MDLQGRDLKLRMQGVDVLQLQTELRQLGASITDRDGFLGQTTRKAVIDFQTQRGLAPTGIVDAQFREVINAALAQAPDAPTVLPSTAVVRGRLAHPDGQPVPGLLVRAFDKEVRSQKLLGEVVTDTTGAYAIGYDSGKLSRPDKRQADLVVRAFGSDNREVAASAAIISAPAEVTVDLVFGNQPYRGPAEYTRLREALAPHLGQIDPAGLTPDEIAYLAAKTGFDGALITHLVAAEHLARRIALPPAVFYGLMRQGLPAGAAALLRRDRGAVQRALQAALDANIIPQGAADPAQVTTAFQQAAVAQAFDPPAEPGTYTLGDLLGTTSLSRAQQESLLLRAAQHDGARAEFWAGLRADPAFGETLVADVQFSLHLGQVTGNYVPLVKYLQGQRRSGAITAGRDLARLDTPAWERMLTTRQDGQIIGAPPRTPGQTEDERIGAYAATLANAFKRLYPTAALTGSLARAAEPAQTELVRFLNQNPDFDLAATSIAAFLPGSNLTGITNVAQLTADLKAMQRVFRLAPVEQRLDAVPELLNAGLDSARSIIRYGKDRFVKSFAPVVGGAAAATQIYTNAGWTAAAALAAYTKYRVDGASPWVIGGIPAGPADIPDWGTLFGSLDYCECKHCRSVYSPAAYLVDLLAFLDQYETTGPIPPDAISRPTALDRLLRLRPDLGEIQLTCTNTDTLLPYVDLAIEVFENAVAGQTAAYQTNWTAAELNANAEHINSVAYDGEHLAGHVYPFELPFNLWLAEARIFLEHLGLSLDQLLEVFHIEPTGTGAAIERAGEYLRLTPLARRVITIANDRPLAEVWGLTGDPVVRLSDAPAFLAQADLSYEGLLELLGTRYVNPLRGTIIINPPEPGGIDPRPGLPGAGQPGPTVPPGPGVPIQIGISISFAAPCTLEGARLNRLTEEALDRIHRFLRLQRGLGWTIRDLDRVLVALGDDDIDEAFLVRLAEVKELVVKFGLPLDELLSWWSNIPTTVYAQDAEQRSLYERLFLNNAVLNPVDPAFALNEEASDLLVIGRLSEHVPAIVAALEISAEDLDLLMAAGATDDTLNLANLSQLYRSVSLAGALGLSIAEFLSARALTGIDPFDRDRISQTLDFVERVEQIQASAFSITELDYLLRHVYDPARGIGVSEEQIRAELDTLRSELSRIAQEFIPLADPTGVITESTLALLLPATDVPTAMAIIGGKSDLGIAEQSTFIQTSFAPFLNPAEAVATLVDPAGLTDPPARYGYVLGAARRYLARKACEMLITQRIAADFALDLAAVQALLFTHVPAALDGLLALAKANGPAVFRAASRSYLLLHKIAMALGKLGAGLADLPWLFGEEYDFGWYHLAQLPLALQAALNATTYRSWERLVGVYVFRDKFPTAGTTLFDLLATGYNSTSTSEVEVWDAVASYTGWPRGEIATLAGPSGLALAVPDDYRDERYLLRLDRAFALLDRIGMPAEAVITWRPTDDTDAMQLTAQSIKQAAKGKHDEATWLTIAPPLQDALREKQRATLVAYLVATMTGIDRPSDLFEHFLIDGEMDACMDTSRIKQAISSVQLFVQRCLMGLEPEIQLPAEAAAQWGWMREYRVWEAARKIFLYPENWIEPDLRDDMTPVFKDLSSELRQSALTDASAETALRHYLAQLDLIDRIEVRSLYHELATADDGTPIDRLHVLARTQNDPHVYYYRQRVDDAYWTAWEPVGIDIAGSHEFLVVHEGTLYLFMPVLRKEKDADWSVTLTWSTYRGGVWTAVTQAVDQLTIQGVYPDVNDVYMNNNEEACFFFKAVPDGDDLLIVTLWDAYGGEGSPYTKTNCLAFRIRCGEKVEIDDQLYRYTIEVPPDTDIMSMTLLEREELNAPLMLQWTDAELGTQLGEVTPGETDEVTILTNTPGQFQIVLPHQYDYYAAQDAFFYHGITRVFHVQPVWSRFAGFEQSVATIAAGTGAAAAKTTARTPAMAPSDALIGGGSMLAGSFNGTIQTFELEKKLRFTTFHHPYLCDFTRRLSQGGVPALLRRAVQEQSSDYFESLFEPNTDVVSTAYPIDEVEFGYGGAYSIYNEELFFHTPLLIAERLRQNQRFAEAQRWYHHIFTPLAGFDETGPERFWNYLPFYRETAGETTLELMLGLAGGDYTVAKQVEQWRKDPFQPHALARLRPQAYQKTVVMKYVKNLIDWGDQLFSQDTIETINEAAQLYVLAANILGDKPEPLPAVEAAPKTFNALRDDLDAFSNALVELENYIAEPAGPTGSTASALPILTLYFGIPPNDTLLALWDTVADRLFKIRHCMNIAGTVRQLPLWEPPIEPGLLVRAAAMGVDLSSVLADLYAPLPHYRFQVMLQKSLDLCSEVRSLGAALLSALERHDAEALALLRTGHETQLLEAIRQVREWQVDEADEARQALERTQESITARQEYYADLLAADWNDYETAQQARLADGYLAQLTSQGLSTAATGLFIAASAVKGGTLQPAEMLDLLGKSSQAGAQAADALATHFNYRANLNALLGNHERRKDEWQFQKEAATKELEQIAKQILAAEIKHDIAKRELENHDIQIANAQATSALMQSKFTNEELYGWMISQIAPGYFSSYQMANDLAKRTERSYRHELGLKESSFIGYGYWDNLKQGLLAGDKLASDLRRLEVAYLDANKREYEVTKHVSLLQLDPAALLALRETGSCEIHVPEVLFDMDFPGHYFRRIKAVRLTIPCVVGPYSNVSATLALTGRWTRKNTNLGDPNQPEQDTTILPQSAIATSTANQDGGVFELSFNDPRYLPFEGAGAISRWRLELPSAIRPFDYDTISDVVLHLSYTARDGGESFKHAVDGQLESALNDWKRLLTSGVTLARLFSLRQEFSADWNRLLNPAVGQPQHVTLKLSKLHFPRYLDYLWEDRNGDGNLEPYPITLGISSTKVYLNPKRAVPPDGDLQINGRVPVESEIPGLVLFDSVGDTFNVSNESGADLTLTVSNGELRAEDWKDVYVLLQYEISA
jgi:hypothetical protein